MPAVAALWTAHVLPLGLGAAPAFGGAGADKITLHIRQSAKYRQHQAPGGGAGVGPRFGQGSKLRLCVHDLLDDGEQVKGAAGDAALRLASFEALAERHRRGPRCRSSLAFTIPPFDRINVWDQSKYA